jgi:hypothetical protein
VSICPVTITRRNYIRILRVSHPKLIEKEQIVVVNSSCNRLRLAFFGRQRPPALVSKTVQNYPFAEKPKKNLLERASPLILAEKMKQAKNAKRKRRTRIRLFRVNVELRPAVEC